MADLELRAGTPYESLDRISGSFRPDPLAGIDTRGRWYSLPAHFRPLRSFIFLTPILPRQTELVYLFPFALRDRVGGVVKNTRLRITFTSFQPRDKPYPSHPPIRRVGFSSSPLQNFHDPFSLSSMRSLTCNHASP